MEHWHGAAGGEPIETVLHQDEKLEYYHCDPGCIRMSCSPSYRFNKSHHVDAWLDNVANWNLPETRHEPCPTLAFMRYEYAHVYFVTAEFYNAFLLMHFFGLNPRDTCVILLDGHPLSHLDYSWQKLFKRVERVSTLHGRIRFAYLILAPPVHNSRLIGLKTHKAPELLEQFRQFFLDSHGINGSRYLDCRRSLNVLFIWRRDYLSHPRVGMIGRKIANEEQLLKRTRELFGTRVNVRGVQLDKYNMSTQLQMVVDTDILIGMHGAALTFTIFLPPHASVIEMQPANEISISHFESIAYWRRIAYRQWRCEHKQDTNKYTEVTLNFIDTCLNGVVNHMCPN